MSPGMRFFKNGPLVPSELLNARDQGRVVFFCGAGVSYARASLPDFYQLTKKTCDALREPGAIPFLKMLTQLSKISRKIGTNLLSMDKIFGLLEQKFGSSG